MGYYNSVVKQQLENEMRTFFIEWKSKSGHVDTFEVDAEDEIQARELFDSKYPNFEILYVHDTANDWE
jgi:hypothetical protein